jgi:hypothetical protein
MKAKLIFDLDVQEDVEDFELMNKAKSLAISIWNICQIKKKLENKFELGNYNKYDVLDEFSKEIAEILEYNQIDIYKLIK